jgi:WD40 repeat protein
MRNRLLAVVAVVFLGGAAQAAEETKPRATFTAKGWWSSLAFSPDGKVLAASSYEFKPPTVLDWVFGFLGGSLMPGGSGYREGDVELWDVTTGKPLASLHFGGEVAEVAFSPDGKTLAATVGANVHLLDPADGRLRERAVLSGKAGSCSSPGLSFSGLVFSADGALLARATCQAVEVWDVRARKQLAIFRGYTGFVYKVAFSPDGKTLATLSRRQKDGKDSGCELKLWDTASGRQPPPR